MPVTEATLDTFIIYAYIMKAYLRHEVGGGRGQVVEVDEGREILPKRATQL